jgi:dienelactone hydrolase
MPSHLKKLLVCGVILFSFSGFDAYARIHTERVEYKEGDTRLYGYLAYDDGIQGRRPGVLIVHEWWGLNEQAKNKAELLAEKGYIALALDMYGEGKVTENPKEAGEWSGMIRQQKDVGRKRFMAAYHLLQGHKLCLKDRIAAIGYCFGGYVVLSMAQSGTDLRGVVSFHGSLPIEEVAPGAVKAKILVCHGADDPMVPSEQVQKFQDHLKKIGADWQFICYGGAKHSFTNPSADMSGIPGLGYNAAADRRSWNAMLSFFDEIFEK